MLRINLLPPYVALRRATKKLFVGFSVLLVALVAVLLGWYFTLVPKVAQEKQMADDAEAAQQKVEDIDTQASTATASIAPIQQKLTFYQGVLKYNTASLDLYHNIFTYTSPEVVYNSLSVSGTTMTISGYTPSFSALGRYLLEMYHEPDISNLNLSSQIPDSSSANPNAPESIALPAGIVGRLPGLPEPVTSYTVYDGKITAVNSGAGGAAPAAPGGFGAPQFAQLAGQATTAKPFDLRHDGFPFTVVLTLKNALIPPEPDASGSGTAAGGAQAGGPPTGGTINAGV